MMKNNDLIWGGVVVYYPNLVKLKKLINALEDQVNKTIIFNNGGCLENEIADLFHGRNFEIIGDGENVGIAKALNEICKLTEENSADYIITFDQDSLPGYSFVSGLHEFIGARCDASKEIAAVGPVFVDALSGKEILPAFQAGPWWVTKIYPLNGEYSAISVAMLITSGMLIKISAWKKIGEFREDFFIDNVDVEWCFRARNKGYDLFLCPSVVMQHELSDESPKRLFGRLVLKYAHIRRYYSFRNTIAMVLDRNTPSGFRIYFLVMICYRFFLNLLIDKSKIKSLKAMLTGIVHGIAGKMGKV